MTRWWPIVGGISLNLALGSLYAWSVFVLPLEKEFGWNRAQTSWVYTIAIVCFAATFIVAGKLQDAKGPRLCAFLGGSGCCCGCCCSHFLPLGGLGARGHRICHFFGIRNLTPTH